MVAAVALLVPACGVTQSDAVPRTPAASPGGAPGRVTPSQPPPSESPPLTEEFPYGLVSNPTSINNRFLPMEPGTYWKWDGVTIEDDEETPHQIITMITDMTKVIDGVTTVVGYDEDWSHGELVEAEIFFAAQDDDGTVWRLGEYPEEYEDGAIVATPAWLAGVEDALAGVMMPADPKRGQRSYAQGWGPAVEWADRGWVVLDGSSECVVVGCFEDVIVVEEWDLADPLPRQLKVHAPGVGIIRVDWSGSADDELELLELVEFKQLSEAELAYLRSRALALEERAYELLPVVFGGTEPMQPRTGAPTATAAPVASERLHVITAGDTLIALAARYYGDEAQWPAILDANRDRIDDPENLRVGTELRIPER